MADRDPLDGLSDLARAGEDLAQPLPPEAVRRLGDRRRARRRTSIVAAAALAAVVAGGAIVTQGTPRADQPAAPAATFEPTATPSPDSTPTPAPTPTPTRTVAEATLIRPDDVPHLDRQRFVQTPAGAGRPDDQVTVCLPEDGTTQLGATSAVSRNFRMDRQADGTKNGPQEPFGNDPTIYTQVLQFVSRSEAEEAYQTYRSWLTDCRKQASANGKVETSDGKWIAVRVEPRGTEAGFDEAQWREPGSPDVNAQYFESVGLVLLDDRLAVIVDIAYGQDYNVSYLPSGDGDTGLAPHPQFGLLEAAARRLG